jgi:hypothetical protein
MYGPELDVVAPSGNVNLQGDILTLDRAGAYGYNPTYISCNPQDIDHDCKFGGTSAAAPQVAGIVSLLLLRRPDLIGQTALLRDIIRYSAEREPFGQNSSDTSRVSDYVVWGRLNAARAILAVVRGDADNSGGVNISDAVYLINYVYNGGSEPQPTRGTGDVDCNGVVNTSDAVSLIGYVYGGCPAPEICFQYSY